MHPYNPTLFSGLEDIPDAAIDEVADEELHMPGHPIEALPFSSSDNSWLYPPILAEGFSEKVLPFSPNEQNEKPSYDLPWGRVPKKLRTTRRSRQLWSLHLPLWHLNSTATCFEVKKACMHCRGTVTPQWRRGPGGPATLCNACGIRFNSGRLLIEYHSGGSATDADTDDSNRHKKVLKTRGKKTC